MLGLMSSFQKHHATRWLLFTSRIMSSSMLIVVTGASRGLGRAIATVACEYVDNLRAILVARSKDGLSETEQLMRAVHQKRHDGQNRMLQISSYVMDLSNLDELDSNIDELIQAMDLDCCDDSNNSDGHSNNSTYDNLVVVNNAGSVGHLGECSQSPSLKDMRDTVDFNITSALWVTTRFTREICSAKRKTSSNSTIVNISSLVALEDFPTMGIYGVGKAARNKYHSVMAKELSASPTLKILNFAPGPLETDMVTTIRSAEQLDKNLKKSFEQKMLDPKDSAKKLIKLLLSNDFESGSHVDYYDLPDEKTSG